MGFFRKPAAAEAGPRIIGIAGTGRGAGATHLCVWSANGLRSGLGRKTAVLEWNRHGDFDRFGRVCTGMEPRNLRYSIQGVDFYPQSGEEILAACIRGPYQEILLDCGVLGEEGDGRSIWEPELLGGTRPAKRLALPGCLWQRGIQKKLEQEAEAPRRPDPVFSRCFFRFGRRYPMDQKYAGPGLFQMMCHGSLRRGRVRQRGEICRGEANVWKKTIWMKRKNSIWRG